MPTTPCDQCPCRWMRLAIVAAVLLIAPGSGAAQIVRGQVVDSISGVPVGGSAIGLLAGAADTLATTLTDAEGLFLLRAPSAGQFRLSVMANGYRESVFPPFAIEAEGVRGFMLLVAPLEPPRLMDGAELAHAICPSSPDRPIMLGLVHDAAGSPIDSASVTFSWETMPSALRRLVNAEDVNAGTATVVTDETGFYAMCDLPPETRIAVHARGVNQQSAFVSLSFAGDTAWVGSERHILDPRLWRHDLEVRRDGDWNGRITGRVTNARSLEPVSDAEIRVGSTNMRTRSDATGTFRFEGLPSGSAALVVQRIGFHPLRYETVLAEGEVTAVPVGALALHPTATELEPIITTAEPGIARPLPGFQERRERGVGSFITREEWERQGNPNRPTDVLARMQGVRVEPNRNYHSQGGPRWLIRTSRGEARTGFGKPGVCPPIYFLDGMYLGNADASDIDIALPFGDLVAVEAYTSIASLPQQFNRPGAQCGVILFWTGR